MYSEVNFAPKAPNLQNSICIEINFFKFRRKHHSYQLVAVFRDLPNRRSTGFNAYWHWVISTSIFKKSWKSSRNSKVPIEGMICMDPVFGILFGDKNEKKLHRFCRRENQVSEMPLVNWCKSAVLDAVLEPAQPLPCGSYLVYHYSNHCDRPL